jgi:hypothetical protein
MAILTSGYLSKWHSALSLGMFLMISFIFIASLAGASGTCVKKPGLLGGPLVSSAEVAKKIYLAVAKDRKDVVVLKQLKVRDINDSWAVYQSIPGFVGGGRLEMRIKKCDGAMTAHYSK